MNRFKFILLFISFSLNTNFFSFGQEQVVPVSQSFDYLFGKLKSSSIDTLEIPFADDFAKMQGTIDLKLWEESDVYINSTLARDPWSIGVATFDAARKTGVLHHKKKNESFRADSLTSRPINLKYPLSKDLKLSFVYEMGGYGDIPEPKDSLIVEFWDLTDKKWDMVWFAQGVENSASNATFQVVLIPIDKEKYRKKGFRFRIRNTASFSATNISSLIANCDHWHVDYVKIDFNTTKQTAVDDIAMIEPTTSFLQNYSSIPWLHTQFALNEVDYKVKIRYRNNSNRTSNITREFFIRDLVNKNIDEWEYLNDVQEGNIVPGEIKSYERPIERFGFNSNADTAVYEIKSLIITDMAKSYNLYNDTVVFVQKLKNYYSYDDGSAEYGYGFNGAGSEGAKTACKFEIYNKDTIRGVYAHFINNFNSANGIDKYFKLILWKAGDKKLPGEVVYRSKEAFKVKYGNRLNEFLFYAIKDTSIVLKPGIFYIGFQQTSKETLNIGLDRNWKKRGINANFDNIIYYRIPSEDWKASKVEGALMVRPVFGQNYPGSPTSAEKINKKELDLKLYPNPVSDWLRLERQNKDQDLECIIYDLNGRMVYSNRVFNEKLNLAHLRTGLYIIRFSDTKGNLITTKKISIIH